MNDLMINITKLHMSIMLQCVSDLTCARLSTRAIVVHYVHDVLILFGVTPLLTHYANGHSWQYLTFRNDPGGHVTHLHRFYAPPGTLVV